ncbi:MAG: NADPH:quinone oxidoreductase family protein [Hyphomonadaceae bacterium]|nr:NADPH:quinone oxidoreductase family protein [Hyphomonadaceae bacterium]
MMRAAVVHEFGPPEGIVLEDRPIPAPGPGEIVARVHAAGVNFADVLMTAGRYVVRPPRPFVPGLEFAGVVTAVGPGAERWRVGDRVMGAPTTGGCFAEYVCLPADKAFAAPEALPFELAAGFLIGHGTAAFSFRRTGLKPGERVLVTGAGGGVGVAAIDVAKRMGAWVVAAAGSADKLAVAKAHGADELIDYRAQDLAKELKARTGGDGVDVVLDTVGGAVFDAALRGMARWGRMAVVGFASGDIPRIAAEYLLVKNLSVIGVGFGGLMAEDPASAQAVIDDLLALHAREPFKAEIAGRYRLDEASAALRRLADRGVTGKLIVTPDPSLL